MPAPTTAELAARMRLQDEAIIELIDIALTAIRESGDSTVSTLHVLMRLTKVRDALHAPGISPAPMHTRGLRH